MFSPQTIVLEAQRMGQHGMVMMANPLSVTMKSIESRVQVSKSQDLPYHELITIWGVM